MQIFGPGLSGLTPVPVTTEGAKKQREWYRKRDVKEGEKEAFLSVLGP